MKKILIIFLFLQFLPNSAFTRNGFNIRDFINFDCHEITSDKFGENQYFKIAFAFSNLSFKYLWKDNRSNLVAFQMTYASQLYLSEIRATHTCLYSKNCLTLAGLSFYFGDYKLALQYYNSWILTGMQFMRNDPGVYNGIGIILQKLNQFQLSVRVFAFGFAIAHESENEIYKGLITGNAALSYLQLNNLNEAIKLFQIDFQISKRNKVYTSAANAQLSIYGIYLKDCNKEINYNFHEVKNFFLNHNQLPNELFHSTKARYHRCVNEIDSAIFEENQSLNIENNLIKTRFSGQLKVVLNSIINHSIIEQDKLFYRLKKIYNLKFILTFGLFTLLFISTYFYISHKSKRVKKEYDIKKHQVLNELESNNFSIESLLKSVDENQKTITELQQIIDFYQDSGTQLSSTNIPYTNLIEKIEDLRINNDEEWALFKINFKKVYPYFIENILKTYPKTTKMEQIVACLMRLNLTAKEISEILSISPDSVRKNITRLRNRLGFTKIEDLKEFIFTIKTHSSDTKK